MRLVPPAAAVTTIEGELQHLHAGTARVLQELVHRGCKEPQVLGNDGTLPKLALNRIEKRRARSLAPAPARRRVGACRNREVRVEAAEMIDAQDIV